MSDKAVVAICKCGKVRYAVAEEAFVTNRSGSKDDLKELKRGGYKITIMESEEMKERFGECECDKILKSKFEQE